MAVIGSEAATEMYGTTHAVGETFSLNGYTLTVVGVLAEVGSSASGSNDNQILIPFTLAQRLSNQTSISSFYVSAASSSQVEQAQAVLGGLAVTGHIDVDELRGNGKIAELDGVGAAIVD